MNLTPLQNIGSTHDFLLDAFTLLVLAEVAYIEEVSQVFKFLSREGTNDTQNYNIQTFIITCQQL